MVNVVNIFKALADETRISIVLALHARGGSSTCPEISAVFNLSQPTMSHHYQKLISSGIIQPRKIGTMMSYHLNYHLLQQVGINLDTINNKEIG